MNGSMNRPDPARRRGGLLRFAGLAAWGLGAFLLAASGCGQTDDSGRGAANAAGEAAGHAADQTNAHGSAPDRVKRGEYLVSSMGCHDCHTPWHVGASGMPEPDMSRSLSGHPQDMAVPPSPQAPLPWGLSATLTMTAWAGPWGTSFSANLTPDMETGTGAWDENLFITAIREGKMKGAGRPMLPPMPWPSYRNLTDEDLKAMFAYLQTIPAIKNRVPEPILPAGGPGAPTGAGTETGALETGSGSAGH